MNPADFSASIDAMAAPLAASIDNLRQNIGRADARKLVQLVHAVEFACSKFSDQPGCNASLAKIYRALDAIELEIAKLFGAQRGWKISRKPFSWDALLSGVIRNQAVTSFVLPRYADHAVFYADYDGKPAAILAHEYRWNDTKRKDCEQYAAMTGIVFEMPVDFPSWWSSGTTLVLWRRKQDGE